MVIDQIPLDSAMARLESWQPVGGCGISLQKGQLVPLSAHQHGAHIPGIDTTTRAQLIASVRRYRDVFPHLRLLADAVELRLMVPVIDEKEKPAANGDLQSH